MKRTDHNTQQREPQGYHSLGNQQHRSEQNMNPHIFDTEHGVTYVCAPEARPTVIRHPRQKNKQPKSRRPDIHTNSLSNQRRDRHEHGHTDSGQDALDSTKQQGVFTERSIDDLTPEEQSTIIQSPRAQGKGRCSPTPRRGKGLHRARQRCS